VNVIAAAGAAPYSIALSLAVALSLSAIRSSVGASALTAAPMWP
jgi:hypothetical protein